MKTSIEEWIKQAEYDLKASERMLETHLPAHATFTIHLALEKILKACYLHKKQKPTKDSHPSLFCRGISNSPSERGLESPGIT